MTSTRGRTFIGSRSSSCRAGRRPSYASYSPTGCSSIIRSCTSGTATLDTRSPPNSEHASPTAPLGQPLRRARLPRLADILVDRLADHSLGQLVEVLAKLLGQCEKLRPQRSLVERLRHPHLHRAVAATGLP